jgi:hypothetical protein
VIDPELQQDDQWGRFELDWRYVLSLPEFDLEYLHMRSMNSGKGRFEKSG